MNIRKQLKDLQYKIVYNRKVPKEEHVSILAQARIYIRQLEARIGELLNGKEQASNDIEDQ